MARLRFCALVRMWKRKEECEQRLNNCPLTREHPHHHLHHTTNPPSPQIRWLSPAQSIYHRQNHPRCGHVPVMLRCRQMGWGKKRWSQMRKEGSRRAAPTKGSLASSWCHFSLCWCNLLPANASQLFWPPSHSSQSAQHLDVGVAEKCNNKYGYQGQTFLKSKSQE